MSTAPQYLVYPLDWSRMVSSEAETGAAIVTNKVCIIDFGESYRVPSLSVDFDSSLLPGLDSSFPPDPNSSLPAELGIPQAYASPEYDLEQKVGIPTDLWALACTIFEIRMRRKLFAMFEAELDEHLFITSTVLGKLPEPWWSETWEGRRDIFKDDADESGRVVAESSNIAMSGRPRSLREAIAPRYEGVLHELNKHSVEDVSEEEVELFSDLLGRLLRYEPKKRISAKEALEHEWFGFHE
ncbi:hypothetical protein IMZ48_39225 [Candidatus Bathyarchaeota archaeon]|nr:hypothetical protein [Candidatus Bathyarchaeota archaeon]